MSFTLTDLRGDLADILATAPDAATWSDAMLDEGVRAALIWYALNGPLFEVDFAVTVPGAEQELSAVAGIVSVEGVVWPWFEGRRWEEPSAPWRRVSPFVVRFDTAIPAAGDLLRVRYRKVQTVNGLDGAATTTVVDAHRGSLAQAAAAQVLLLRLRQMSENPALPTEAAGELRRLHERYLRLANETLDALCAGTHSLVWGRVGL